MNVGVLCDSNGHVKRTWSLINGHCTVPLEHGDEVLEWTMAHGHEETDTVRQEAQRRSALTMQEALGKATTREHALTLSEPHAATRQHRRVHIPLTPPADRETLFCSDGKMASREKGAQHFPTQEAAGHMESLTPKTTGGSE